MKRMELVCTAVLCLLMAVTCQGQISLNPAYSQQNEGIQSQQYCVVSDSGYMILTYDDGIAENYCVWQLAGNMMAVKYDIPLYSVSVIGARVYVGDGSYPAGGNILNQPFLVSVYDSDGENGMPGTLIDSISAIVKDYGWVTVTGLWATTSRSFYIVITQLSDAPDCIAIGVDETLPKANQGYSRNVISGNPWIVSPYQDMMINALISTNVGVDDRAAASSITVSPNPAHESARLEFPSGFNSVSVFNATGSKVYRINIANLSNVSINTSRYSSGIYHVRFTAANGDSYIRKLLVVH